jgi:hypothetical protein
VFRVKFDKARDLLDAGAIEDLVSLKCRDNVPYRVYDMMFMGSPLDEEVRVEPISPEDARLLNSGRAWLITGPDDEKLLIAGHETGPEVFACVVGGITVVQWVTGKSLPQLVLWM